MNLHGSRVLFRALRAIVRSESRGLMRHRFRSLLILALVAIPVAAVVGGTTVIRITTPTDEERRGRAMGRAALRIEAPFEYDARRRILDLLPDSVAVQSWREGVEIVRVPGRQLVASAIILGESPWPDRPAGLAEGSFLLLSGRIPANAGEVALSTVLLAGLDRSPGEVVSLEFGGYRTIVGVVAEAESAESALVVRTAATVEHKGQGYLLVGSDRSDDTQAIAANLRANEIEVTRREDITGEGGELAWGLFVLGTIGFLEAGLVVASTFIVGLRRRQYEIGLLGSTGATARQITLSLLASTAALAIPGVVVGALLGTGAAALLYPALDAWNGRFNGPFELAWGTLIAAMFLGVVVALLATVVPSWTAARMPIRIALGGRRPIRTRSTVWLTLGLGMVGVGLALVVLAPRDNAVVGALAAIVGSILGVLGFGVSSPFLLDVLGRAAGRLPLRWRLAVRDAGRFRARNGPVVTAVLAGMSMSVTIAVLLASLDDALGALPSSLRTDQLLIAGPDAERVATRLSGEFSAVATARLEAVYLHGEPVRVQAGDDTLPSPARQWIAAGDENFLRAIGAEAGIAALERGELLQIRSHEGGWMEMLGIAPEAGDATFEFTTWRDGRAVTPLPVARIDVDQNVMTPAYVLHRSRVERLGWETGPPIDRSLAPWLVRGAGPITPAMLARAQKVAGSAIGVTIDAERLRRNPVRGFYHVVQLLCILTGLVIVLVATALSSVESAADARVLYTIGAAPGLLRGHEAARAAYLAFLGCLLAIPAGLTPAIVLFEAANLPLDPVIPWFDLAVALLALPLLAYGVSWLLTREEGRRRWSRERFAGALVAAALLSGSLAQAEVPEVRWEPFQGRAFDGSPLAGELGRLLVPRRHADPDGPTLELAFVRYRTTHPDPGPPIFYLAGGPGGSGVEHAGGIATHPQMRFLEQADVIGLDQRGTGLGQPGLDTPGTLTVQLPLDRPVQRDEVIAALTLAAERTARHWRGQGVDPTVYNSRESADDIDAVRRALGLQQIVLHGSSYGTHLAIAHMRRHPDTVARAILDKVEGPDHTWKLPRTVQAHLENLHARCGADPRVKEEIPDLLALVTDLLSRLAGSPVTIHAPGSDTDPDAAGEPAVVAGPYDLRLYLSNALSTSPSIAEIPRNLVAFSRGDWAALYETAREHREIRIDLMPWATDCASGATPARRASILQQSRDPGLLLGDAILAPFYPETCEPCAGCDLGDAYRSQPEVDAPVLFTSGTFDVRTPPGNVEAIESGFSRHAHIVVERAGHESRELMSPEYRALFQAFLRGEEVAGTTITLPALLFEMDGE